MCDILKTGNIPKVQNGPSITIQSYSISWPVSNGRKKAARATEKKEKLFLRFDTKTNFLTAMMIVVHPS